MSEELAKPDRQEIEAIVRQLQEAWNAGSGSRFAEVFTEDADFVTVRGDHLKGQSAIKYGLDKVLQGVYASSRNQYDLTSVRQLRPDVAIAHVKASLEVPSGPLAGKDASLLTLVFTREQGSWLVAAQHNTFVAAARQS